MLSITVVLTVIAFFLAVGYKVNIDASHFATPHEIIGIIIFLLALAEPVLGYFADKLWYDIVVVVTLSSSSSSSS